MPIDVSVVVPTYNTGPKLEPLLASLAAQSLPEDRYEIVVVDDGSTDDTWQRLQRLAERLPVLRTERIPNSGWPGRPRNVGTDLARGRYVFYSDHDDEFFPEALERMVALADRAEADVVVGKEVRSGALSIGSELFVADRERADLFRDHVLALITPHKLFRTSFLRERGIRFPEGRRRLEDHVFLAEVYTKTDRIAVLASYPCYRWIIYPDQSNNSSSLGDLRVYFDSLDDVFTVLEQADIPEQRRDDLVRFWYGAKMLKQLWGFWFEAWPEDYRATAVEVIGDLAAKRIPVELDAGLEPLLRRRADLLRRGDIAGILAVAESDHRVHLRVDSSVMEWTAEGLRVHLAGVLVDRHEEPVLLTAQGEGLFWPDDLSRAYDLAPWLSEATVDLFVRQQDVGTEWHLGAPSSLVTRDTPQGTVLEASASFVVDPTRIAFGQTLDDGPWSVYSHLRAFGYQSRARLTGGAPGWAVLDGVPVVAVPNRRNQTVLSVGATPRLLRFAVGSAEASGRGRAVRVAVELRDLCLRGAPPSGFRLRIGGTEVEAALAPGSPARLVATAALPPGSHELRVVYGDQSSRPLLTIHAGSPWRRVRTAGPRAVPPGG